MSFSEEHIELFGSYLEGTLSETERDAFEKRLSEDAELQRAFDDFKEFELALQDVETIETYDQIGAWESKHQQSQKNTPIRKLWAPVIGVAAAAAVLLFVFLPDGESNASLTSEYFLPYENVVTVRGKKEVLDQAMSAYDRKEYEKALKLLNQYPNDSIGIFYRAESLMALERYEEAVTLYDEILDQDGVFNEVAAYHQALAYLGNDQVNKAKVALKNIPSNSHYFDRAKDLLDRL